MEMVMFFILAIVAVAAGIGVVAQRNAARSALFLLTNFCCLAGLYLLLNAQFVAIVQIVVYAGAVVVLFLFVVMLLGAESARSVHEEAPDPATRSSRQRRQRFQWIAGVVLGVLLLASLIWALVPGPVPDQALVETDNVREIGAALLTDFAIPFELVSVVLLVAIIGAVVLAKKKVA